MEEPLPGILLAHSVDRVPEYSVGPCTSKAPIAVMPRSLRSQLFLLWIIMAGICCALAVLLFGLYGQTEGVKRAEAQQQVENACRRITQRYLGAGEEARSASHANGLRDVVLQLVLADFNGVEGGIWSRHDGPVNYAYPTYQGSGIKSDVPAAERSNIEVAAQGALSDRRMTLYTRASDREILLLAACPLDADTSAWTMTRVATVGAGIYHRLLVGMSLLLLLVVASASGAGLAFRRWDRKLAEVERALAQADAASVPAIPATGSKELDRLGEAVTRYATRLAESRATEARLTTQLARHDRLVSLGRLVATIAHEIRNPIATMQLTAENALAEKSPTNLDHLEVLLAQIQRLDGVVESLLSMVQPIHLHVRTVAVESWLQEVMRDAGSRSVALHPMADPTLTWRLDPDHLGRAVDNLLRNAAQHSAPGAMIRIEVQVLSDVLYIDVINRGNDIPPALRDQLFEPFVSGRVDGNGLGLALVLEIVQAHHGSVHYRHHGGETHFTLELPWRAS